MNIQKNNDLLFGHIIDLIESTKSMTIQQVNSNLTLLYWHIGKHINEHVLKNERGEYGKQVLPSLSERLISLYGKGYSEPSLARMVKFHNFFPENILSSVMTKLTWTHFIQLLTIKEPL